MISKTELVLDPSEDITNTSEVIEQQIANNSLLIYMKGNADMPQCGFSAQVIEIFNRLGVKYKTFNVLSNMEIREGIKQYSNWPTIPQVYYQQKFIGGCDIITQMYESGELDQLLGI